MKRSDFDQWFPAESMLRQLAGRIAGISDYVPTSFLAAKGPRNWPDNFLANAELGAAWHRPPAYILPTPGVPSTAGNIATWKAAYAPGELSLHEQHGFENGRPLSRRGLALLFDPFVDAFLAAHVKASGSIPPGCTVIVLSDYFTFAGLRLAPARTDDWGLCETLNTLGGILNGPDRTTEKLFDCICGTGRWKGDGDVVRHGIVSKKLLLWNFLPMFHGGTSATSVRGVPPPGAWQLNCWDYLSQFVGAVGAATVVLACSQRHLAILRSLTQVSAPIGLRGLGRGRIRSLPPLPSCVQEVWRINHPFSWGLGKCPNDCQILQQVLA